MRALIAAVAGVALATLPQLGFAADTGMGKGEYLARAADCVACHTAPGGQPFAGGRAFQTPFGVIYSPNITPDAKTGIGGYSDEEFISALQKGVGRGGKHLYPAMPYASYTLMTREDVLAMKAYIMGLAPGARTRCRRTSSNSPINQRALMIGWNMVNNSDHRFEPDAKQSAEWNRGAYVTEALGHCQQCHTPRNFMQGLKSSSAYAGAPIQGWNAYNITSDKTAGIGGWSDADLASYLSTGHADGHGSASGPMAEAIENSLRYLTPDDIKAMVTYLKTVPPQPGNAAPAPTSAKPDVALGGKIFEEACQSCHRANGTGSATPYAALLGSPSVTDPSGTNLVAVLLYGSHIDTVTGVKAMPGFAHGYTDVELAAVANYTIAQFGKVSGAVTREAVAKARTTVTD